MIRFEILGTVDLKTADGATADAFLKQPKSVGLLAFLAVARPNGFVRRDELLGMLWPDLDQTSARRALSSQLYRVRQQLGPDVVESRGADEVGLGSRVWCDAAEFLRLLGEGSREQALELYRGPLLPGFYLPTADSFERWLDEQRTLLVRQALDSAWAVTEEARSAGDLGRAIRWARQALAISPHDEPGFRKLLSLFAAAGDRAGALQAYDAFARQLKREFEIEPSPETQALIRQIARTPAGPLPAADPVPPAPVPRAPVPATAPPATPTPAEPAPMAAVATTPSIADEYLGGSVVHTPLPRRRKVVWLGVAAVVALAGVLSSFFLPADRKARVKDVMPRVAILYLDVDQRHEYLRNRADALTESLIARMSGSEHFEVLSSSAVRRFRISDGLSALRELAPTHVVHGSMRGNGDQVRVHIELMDAASGTNRFSAQIDRDTASLFELTDELVREISTMLRMELGKEVKLASWNRTASNPEAARMLHRAELSRVGAARVLQFDDRVAEQRLLTESDSFARLATKLDPTWPEPDVLRATNAIYLFFNALSVNDASRKQRALLQGIEAATSALRKQPNYAPALEKRGYLLMYGWADGSLPEDLHQSALRDAESDLKRATALDPHRALAWAYLSSVYEYRSNFREAYWAAERAYQLDAFMEGWPAVLGSLFSTAFELREYEAAEDWCREIERRMMDDWVPAYCRLMLEAYTPAPPRQIADAWLLAEQAATRVEEPRRPGIQLVLEPLIAAIIARSGMPDSAARVLERAYERREINREALRLIAATWHAMGEPTEARRILDEYLGARENAAHVLSSWLFEGLDAPGVDQHITRRPAFR